MFGIQFASALFRNRSPRRRETTRYRPVVHGLEDRCLLSTFNEYPLLDLPRIDGAVNLTGITAGPDGNVWFTDTNAHAIGRIGPDGGISEFVLRNSASPVAIVAGPDGNLWYGGPIGDFEAMIGQITPDGASTQFAIPTFLSGDGEEEPIQALTIGPDGNVLYGQFVYPADSAIGEVTPDGQATASLVPGHAEGGILSITAGPDGNVWFIPEFLRGHEFVERVTPDGQYTTFEIPGVNNAALSISGGPDGNLWATVVHFDPRNAQHLSASIDQITPDGQFTDFPLPGGDAQSITVGPDGNLWFTEPDANQIGMITLDGQVTEYQVPTPNSRPGFITTGPDGNLWFTESGSGQIGEFVLGDGTGPAATHGLSPALAQAFRTAAVDAVFTGAHLDVASGVSAQPSAAATIATGSSLRPLEAVTASQAQPAVANASGPHHHPTHATEAVGIVGLADPLAEIP